MTTFNQVILFTDTDGRAKFRDEALPMPEGNPQAMLSKLQPSGGYQIRHSPVGFRSQFHCTITPQWVFILDGTMEILLQDGSSRVFSPVNPFTPTTQFLQVRFLMPLFMDTGAANWAISPW